MKHAPLCAAAVALFLAVSPPARAAGPSDQAAAVALFQDGKQLAASGDYQHACPKFQEAQRLFPTTGTLLNLGDCYEKLGKFASAWGAFKEAALMSRNNREPERQAEAERRAQAIEGSLSKLTIAVGDSERLPGIEVRRNGELVGEGQWGTAVPVDAGELEVQVSAPGYRPWTTRVVVPPKVATTMVAVPRLALEVKEAPPEGSWWGPQRAAGVGVLGAGGVAAIVGAAFGGVALSKKSASNADGHCDAQNFCDGIGKDLRAQGMRAGNVSTGAFIAAGVLVGVGVTVLATASKTDGSGARAALSVGPGQIRIEGRW